MTKPVTPDSVFRILTDLERRLEIAERQLVIEPWREVGAAGQPAFVNNWVNYSIAYAGAAFYIDPFGVVRLRGLIKSGTSNDVFTLPVGYRPAANVNMASLTYKSAYGFCEVNIASATGIVSVYSNFAFPWDWASLNNISFRAT